MITRKQFLLAVPAAVGASCALAAERPSGTRSPSTLPISGQWRHDELRRFKAREAHQGVATDGRCFYAISNRAIGKYRIETGERLGGWMGEKDGPIVHLNAATVRNGRLYGAHSNYPGVPMLSSVEIWDTATMQHVDSHSFGIDAGSLTWLAWRDGRWLACFAQYAASSTATGRNPSWTQVVQFDDRWRRMAGWVFPPELIERFAGNSSSGGAFGPHGFLFITGHDARELYVLEFPKAGSVLRWMDTVPISAEGQAFDFDPADPANLFSISRRSGEVILARISRR